MSESTDDPRSAQEIACSLEKIQAETLVAQAEARKIAAEADEAELKAKEANLRWKRAEREHKIRWAEDLENHVYRFSGPVDDMSVQECMQELSHWSRIDPACDIDIVFSSPGGSIISGFELFDFIQTLRSSGHQITTGSLGYAASMAGVLLQSGSSRWIGHQSWMMIHRAAFGAFGKTFEIEDEVKFVKRIEERIINIFTARSSLTSSKIKRNWDRKDWWLSADECLELGLVDEIRGVLPEMNQS